MASEFCAVILAAGVGRRLWPLTKYQPKPMIQVAEGRTLLDWQLETMLASPVISEAVVVTGHLSTEIERHLEATWPSVRTVFNPFYRHHGPLTSIWSVASVLEERDVLIANGDTILRSEGLAAVADWAEDSEGVALLVSRSDEVLEDEVSVRIGDGRVRQVGKGLAVRGGRSAGVLAISGEAARGRTTETLKMLSRTDDFLEESTPWHQWVDEMVHLGVPITALEVPGELWTEIDMHLEVEELRSALVGRMSAFRAADR